MHENSAQSSIKSSGLNKLNIIFQSGERWAKKPGGLYMRRNPPTLEMDDVICTRKWEKGVEQSVSPTSTHSSRSDFQAELSSR